LHDDPFGDEERGRIVPQADPHAGQLETLEAVKAGAAHLDLVSRHEVPGERGDDRGKAVGGDHERPDHDRRRGEQPCDETNRPATDPARAMSHGTCRTYYATSRPATGCS
jgi:hypothetical protein